VLVRSARKFKISDQPNHIFSEVVSYFKLLERKVICVDKLFQRHNRGFLSLSLISIQKSDNDTGLVVGASAHG
jgi:hypothetical protein